MDSRNLKYFWVGVSEYITQEGVLFLLSVVKGIDLFMFLRFLSMVCIFYSFRED